MPCPCQAMSCRSQPCRSAIASPTFLPMVARTFCWACLTSRKVAQPSPPPCSTTCTPRTSSKWWSRTANSQYRIPWAVPNIIASVHHRRLTVSGTILAPWFFSAFSSLIRCGGSTRIWHTSLLTGFPVLAYKFSRAPSVCTPHYSLSLCSGKWVSQLTLCTSSPRSRRGIRASLFALDIRFLATAFPPWTARYRHYTGCCGACREIPDASASRELLKQTVKIIR